jgi:hypothetical protein
VRLPLASMAAIPPAASAMTNTMMRERFIPLQLSKKTSQELQLAKNATDRPCHVPGQNFPSVTRQPDRPPCRNFIS